MTQQKYVINQYRCPSWTAGVLASSSCCRDKREKIHLSVEKDTFIYKHIQKGNVCCWAREICSFGRRWPRMAGLGQWSAFRDFSVSKMKHMLVWHSGLWAEVYSTVNYLLWCMPPLQATPASALTATHICCVTFNMADVPHFEGYEVGKYRLIEVCFGECSLTSTLDCSRYLVQTLLLIYCIHTVTFLVVILSSR